MSIIDESYNLNEPFFKKHSYIEWLKSFVFDEHDSRSYSMLLAELWRIPFYGGIRNDVDRAEEGFELRIRYNAILAKNSGIDFNLMPNAIDIFGPCRVLEMLVALSMRMYDIMDDMVDDNSVYKWFWVIIENIGLDIYDDEHYNLLNGSVNIEKTLDMIMLRKGSKRLPGGWFLTKNWQEKEIWYQMHEFLNGVVSG